VWSRPRRALLPSRNRLLNGSRSTLSTLSEGCKLPSERHRPGFGYSPFPGRWC
jgi:hypothetical protein